jgi:hypothetical protein
VADPARGLKQAPAEFLLVVEMLIRRQGDLRPPGQQYDGSPGAVLHLAVPQTRTLWLNQTGEQLSLIRVAIKTAKRDTAIGGADVGICIRAP